MILQRLRIDGFGLLHGEWRFDPTRVNLFVGENEMGKTTFAAAIAAALYGLESDKRSWRDGRVTPLEHYRPWSGRAYGLELEFDLPGHRYVITRNFATGRLTVLEDGRDATEDFRVGSGEYKVGDLLLGMTVEQFARSALWLQEGPGRLGGDDVRPDDSLSSKLENMSSSITGDASSAQALRVLDEALRGYRGEAQTGLVANEIKKLQVAVETCASDLKAAESDRAQLADAVARIADLAERETSLEAGLKGARRAGAARRLAELRDRLSQDAEARAQIAVWREEAAKLEPARGTPRELVERLRKAEAEREAAQHTLDALAATRSREVTGPRGNLEGQLAAQSQFAFAAPGHIEELAGLEKDLARVAEQKRVAQTKQGELESDLERRGVTLERVRQLAGRFADLSGEDQGLLTQYPAQTQAIVVESENAQRSIAGAQARIEAVRAARGRLRLWGFLAAGVGLLAGAAAVWLAVRGEAVESFVGLGLTLLAIGAGVVLLLRSGTHQGGERSEALKQMLDAQRKLGDLRTRRQERETQLAALAGRLHFEDVTQLLREHGEHLRLTVEGQRLGWVSEDRVRATQAEAEAISAMRRWAERAQLTGDGSEEPHAVLARVRQGIGIVLDLRARLRELEQRDRGFAAQEEEARARQSRATDEVAALAGPLGLNEGGAPLDAQALAARAEERARDFARLTALEGEILPAAEARVLSEDARAKATAEIEALEKESAEPAPAGGAEAAATAAPGAAAPAGDPARIEQDLSLVRKERLELAGRIGGRDRDAGARIAKLLAERDRFAGALERARRFQAAVELAKERMQAVARETHARWSENIATRVDELLTRFGLGHHSFRVSDKLEASLSIEGDRLGQARLDQALSAGARDQLQLALRLAVCEYLARGGLRLPILLDDPFATSDDERTQKLFRSLVEAVRAGHQVIVLTCHRAKIDTARAADPAWFGEAVVEEAFR